MGKLNGRVLIDRNRETTFLPPMASLALTANVVTFIFALRFSTTIASKYY